MMRRAILLVILALALALPVNAAQVGHTVRVTCAVTPELVVSGAPVTTIADGIKPATWGVFLFDYTTQTYSGPYAIIDTDGSKSASFTMPAPAPGSYSFRWWLWYANSYWVQGPGCAFTVV